MHIWTEFCIKMIIAWIKIIDNNRKIPKKHKEKAPMDRYHRNQLTRLLYCACLISFFPKIINRCMIKLRANKDNSAHSFALAFPIRPYTTSHDNKAVLIQRTARAKLKYCSPAFRLLPLWWNTYFRFQQKLQQALMTRAAALLTATAATISAPTRDNPAQNKRKSP